MNLNAALSSTNNAAEPCLLSKAGVPARSGRFSRLMAPLALLLTCTGLAGGLLAWSARSNAVMPQATPPSPGLNAAGPTQGEHYLWRPVAIGGGGFMVGISSDAAGKTLVARTDVHGAYMWRPELDQWVQMATEQTMPQPFRRPASLFGGVYGLVVAPSDGNRLYMAVKGTILHSDDRGQSWHLPLSGPFPLRFGVQSQFMRRDPVLAVDPTNPDLVFYGSGFDGVIRSQDGGKTWEKVRGLPAPSAATADIKSARPALVWFTPPAAKAGRIWALMPGAGMFASTDARGSFRRLARGKNRGPVTLSAGDFTPDGTFFGTDPDSKTVWRYRKGKWTDFAKADLLPRARYLATAVNPRNGEVFVFEHNGRAHRSADEGETWSRLSFKVRVGDRDPPWLRIADQRFFATAQVMFDPVVADRLWVTAGTGLFHADVPPGTRSLTWISQTRGIEELGANDVVQAPGHAPLFAAWDFGIHMKPDLNAFSTSYGPKQRVLIAAQQLALTAADADFVATNASDTRDCCAQDGESVLAGYSEDAGRTWRRFETLPHPPGTKAEDPWRMAWGMIAVSSGNPDNIVWAPSLNRAPFYTRDRGRTWARVKFPGERLPFTGSHPKRNLQRKVLVADPVRAGTFYLVHSGNPDNPQLQGLWRTEDGGANWSRLYKGEIAPKSGTAAKLRAMPGREGHLFFTSAVEGPHDSRLRRSNDGGRTWISVPDIAQVNDIAFGKAAAGSAYPTIFLSAVIRGEYGIWRSVDDGKTWARLAGFPIGRLDRVVVLGADPDVFGRIYIGWQGSGWMYGEPATCRTAEPRPFAIRECFAVREPDGAPRPKSASGGGS